MTMHWMKKNTHTAKTPAIITARESLPVDKYLNNLYNYIYLFSNRQEVGIESSHQMGGGGWIIFTYNTRQTNKQTNKQTNNKTNEDVPKLFISYCKLLRYCFKYIIKRNHF